MRYFIDDMDLRGHEATENEDMEAEVDRLASDALIPPEVWETDPARTESTSANVKSLAERLKISPACVAGRMRFEKRNYKLLTRNVGNRTVRKQFAHCF